jgi:hypothetical protein
LAPFEFGVPVSLILEYSVSSYGLADAYVNFYGFDVRDPISLDHLHGYSVTVAQIPEPATAAMVSGGLFLAAFAIQRRRKHLKNPRTQ